MTNIEAAVAFVNRAGARLVSRDCQSELPGRARYTILLPPENDSVEFRAALRGLRLDYLPVTPRTMPLEFWPSERVGE